MIEAFKALRYNPRKVPDLRPVVQEMREKTALNARAGEAHPYVAGQLMHPQNSPEAFRQLIDRLLEHQVLLQEKLPCIYPYVQTFEAFGRRQLVSRYGFIAMVDLAGTRVYPHEAVLEPSIKQRLKFLRKTGLQAIPTHGLYQDNDFLLERLIQNNLGYPLAEVVDSNGVRHTLGRITDLKLIQRCRDVLRDKEIYLADGHHRLETHQRFLKEYREMRPSVPAGKLAYHLMYLSNFSGDDLRIRPFHRMVTLPQGFSAEDFEQALKEFFQLKPVSGRVPLTTILSELGDGGMVYLSRKQTFSLTLKPEFRHPAAISLPLSDTVKSLMYTVLHYFVFDRILGIPYAEQSHSQRLHYFKSSGQTQKRVLEGEGSEVAFLMPEIRPETMMAVCRGGDLMPQKSTYFYPKVQGGMLFHQLF